MRACVRACVRRRDEPTRVTGAGRACVRACVCACVRGCVRACVRPRQRPRQPTRTIPNRQCKTHHPIPYNQNQPPTASLSSPNSIHHNPIPQGEEIAKQCQIPCQRQLAPTAQPDPSPHRPQNPNPNHSFPTHPTNHNPQLPHNVAQECDEFQRVMRLFQRLLNAHAYALAGRDIVTRTSWTQLSSQQALGLPASRFVICFCCQILADG
jgi:hypothetical protein